MEYNTVGRALTRLAGMAKGPHGSFGAQVSSIKVDMLPTYSSSNSPLYLFTSALATACPSSTHPLGIDIRSYDREPEDSSVVTYRDILPLTALSTLTRLSLEFGNINVLGGNRDILFDLVLHWRLLETLKVAPFTLNLTWFARIIQALSMLTTISIDIVVEEDEIPALWREPEFHSLPTNNCITALKSVERWSHVPLFRRLVPRVRWSRMDGPLLSL
ncbi:hypothetical protein CONPUDRAFT_148094 [Coniophora puteana RWD-64-598 SS2]|uniref:Uncharacterized protein n=1 Tax=Coniophora puteana (strain RWD-64-598) TaxID=741705 RepID=A0A5M3N3M7_CONPW|nr:uncharacterized protein CONPUDRAFT_148094 [Coniophora puteana RWD-64-598 SS2]EIW85963.1 hypothetical protein CONPUDRAFT_148094 [Coniophora puteana RWD-64-598 SS2]